MFSIYVLTAIIYFHSVQIFAHAVTSETTHVNERPHNSLPCNIGDVTENEKVKCVCALNEIYECSPAVNSSNKAAGKEEGIPKQGEPECNRRMMYTYDTTTCICSRSGTWRNSKCASVFSAAKKNKFCKPNTYVFVECNVCKCNAMGEIDKEQCTKNNCQQNMLEIRRANTYENVNGSCEPGTWYSLAPCQFCYCAYRNKLVCGSSEKPKRTEMGLYNLNVCGKNLLTDIIELLENPTDILRISNLVQNILVTPLPTETTPEPAIEHTPQYAPAQLVDYQNNDAEDLLHINNNDKIEYVSSDESTNNLYKMGEMEDGSTQLPSDDDNITTEKAKKIERENTEEPNTGLKELIEQSLPKMLSTLWKLALRKSMVKLDSDSQCEPGTSFKKDNCNTCFCLVNGKLLCTDKPCK